MGREPNALRRFVLPSRQSLPACRYAGDSSRLRTTADRPRAECLHGVPTMSNPQPGSPNSPKYTAPQAAAPPAAPRPPRRWLRRLSIAFVTLVLLFVASPYLLGSAPVRNLLLRLAVSQIDGKISCGQARLGWFSAPAFFDISISPPTGPPLLSIAKIEVDRPLWKLIAGWPDCGRVVCERPIAHLIVDDTGSNFKRVFAPLAKNQPQPDDPHKQPWTGVPQVRAEVEITDAGVIFERVAGDGASQITSSNEMVVTRVAAVDAASAPEVKDSMDEHARWEVKGIHVVAGLRPIAGGEGLEAYVEPGKLIDHAELTRAVATQWLQFIAPVISGATEIDGSFSVDLEEWRVPLEHPDQAAGGGHVVIHSLVIEAGPMISYIASLVGVPPELFLGRDTGVDFAIENRRVFHRDLGFKLGGLPVHTSGSVGLDRTLDLLAEITLPKFADSTGPLRHAISGKTIHVPIHGTLQKPEVDGKALASSGMGILDEAFGGLLDRLTGQSGPTFPETHTPGDAPATETPPGEASPVETTEAAPAAPAEAIAGTDTAPAAPATDPATASAPADGQTPATAPGPAAPGDPAAAAGDAAAAAIPIVEELLKAWRSRRQQARTAPAAPGGVAPAAPGDAAVAPPASGASAGEAVAPAPAAEPRHPLREGWRRFRDRRRRPADEPAPAASTPAPGDA